VQVATSTDLPDLLLFCLRRGGDFFFFSAAVPFACPFALLAVGFAATWKT
jgi:hypothetical protein